MFSNKIFSAAALIMAATEARKLEATLTQSTQASCEFKSDGVNTLTGLMALD